MVNYRKLTKAGNRTNMQKQKDENSISENKSLNFEG